MSLFEKSIASEVEKYFKKQNLYYESQTSSDPNEFSAVKFQMDMDEIDYTFHPVINIKEGNGLIGLSITLKNNYPKESLPSAITYCMQFNNDVNFWKAYVDEENTSVLEYYFYATPLNIIDRLNSVVNLLFDHQQILKAIIES